MEWVVCLFLLFASAEDLCHRKVKNLFVLALFAAILAENFALIACGRFFVLTDRFLTSFLVFASFLSASIRSGGVGGADTKVAALVALHAGLTRTLVCLPISIILMLLFALLAKLRNRPQHSAPYIPFLSIAYFAAMYIV